MKRKRHLRKSVRIILTAAALGISGCIIYDTARSHRQKDKTISSVTGQSDWSRADESEETTSSFKLFLMGDALCQEQLLAEALQPDGTWNFGSMLDNFTAQVSGYDLAFYNQESTIGGDGLGITVFPAFNSPQAFGDYMISKAFNLVSLANNHSLDRGEQAVHNSNAYWKSEENVVTAGTNESFEEQQAINIHTCNGITYAFNAWTYGMNGNTAPAGEEYLVNCYRDDKEAMLEWVKQADQQADLVIISMHWGTEYTDEPDDEQIQLAQELADAGADVIIGNHPHHIQPVAYVGDHTIVFYALGNGISSQDTTMGGDPVSVLTGMIASLTVTKTTSGQSSKTNVSEEKSERSDFFDYPNL